MTTLTQPGDNAGNREVNPFAAVPASSGKPPEPGGKRRPKDQKRFYGKVPKEVYADVSRGAGHLYGWLSARYGGYKAGIFPKVATLAADLDVSDSTVRRWLRELVRTGWLTMTPRPPEPGRRHGSDTNVYKPTKTAGEAAALRKARASSVRTKGQVRKAVTDDTLSLSLMTPLNGEFPQDTPGISAPETREKINQLQPSSTKKQEPHDFASRNDDQARLPDTGQGHPASQDDGLHDGAIPERSGGKPDDVRMPSGLVENCDRTRIPRRGVLRYTGPVPLAEWLHLIQPLPPLEVRALPKLTPEQIQALTAGLEL